MASYKEIKSLGKEHAAKLRESTAKKKALEKVKGWKKLDATNSYDKEGNFNGLDVHDKKHK